MTSPLSILVVEDEPLIAMMLEDFLQELGHRVAAVTDSVAGALAQMEAGSFDIAILDVHLRGGATSWPVADRMAAAGLPFILATGGDLEPPPPRHAAAPVLGKPFTMDAVREALEAATAALKPL